MRKDAVAQLLIHARRVLQIHLLRFFDQGIDDIDLTPGAHLALDAFIDARALIFADDDSFNRRSAGRKLVNDGDIQIAVSCHSKRARDGCRGHHEHVRVKAARANLCALQDAEAVLLVNHDETEFLKLHRLLNQRMRADAGLNLAGRDVGLQPPFLGGAQRSDQQFDAIRRAREQATMQNVTSTLTRHHQRGLIVVLHRGKHRHQRDNGFATANITLKQTIHRRIGLHVVEDTIDDALLRARQSEGKNLSEMLTHAVCNFYHRAFGFFDSLAALDSESHRHPEKLLEDETQVSGAACAFVIRERHVFGWKVYATQGVCARDEVMARAQVCGERLRDGFVSY